MTPSSLPSRPACRCPLGASLCRLDSIYATCPEKAGILPFLVPRGSGGGIPRDWRAAARMERPTFFFHKMNRQRCGSQHSHFQQRLPQFQVDKLSFDLCSAINGDKWRRPNRNCGNECVRSRQPEASLLLLLLSLLPLV